MICPITTEQITKSHDSRDELIRQWQEIFCIASGIHFFGVIFYAIFASGEIFLKINMFLKSNLFFLFLGEQQDWATAGETEEKMEMNNDFEQPNRGYGYGANPNVVSEAPPSYDEVSQPLQPGPAQPSANPFTSGQNNPFRQ